MSLSWTAGQLGQSQSCCPIFRSVYWYPHLWQIWDDGKNRSTCCRAFPCLLHLSFIKRRILPHAILWSLVDNFPFFRIPLMFRFSMHIRSYFFTRKCVSLWYASWILLFFLLTQFQYLFWDFWYRLLPGFLLLICFWYFFIMDSM